MVWFIAKSAVRYKDLFVDRFWPKIRIYEFEPFKKVIYR